MTNFAKPASTSKPRPSLKFIISTANHFYEKTLPVLIPGMLNAGVPKGDIIIGCGQNKSCTKEEREGLQYLFLPERGFEWIGLACLLSYSMVDESDFWFMIHDTCEVGERFYSQVLTKFDELTAKYDNPKEAVQYVRLNKDYWSMNMGLYSSGFIKTKENFIKSMLRNGDDTEDEAIRHKAVAVQNEDAFCKNSTGWLNSKMKDPKLLKDRYETGQKRRVEIYPEISLTKYKANHNNTNIIDLDKSTPFYQPLNR
jgi:hypothetical protein